MGIGLLLALVFLEYSGLGKKIRDAVSFIASGALSLILGGVFMNSFWSQVQAADVANAGFIFFNIIGWFLVLVGIIWGMYDLITKR